MGGQLYVYNQKNIIAYNPNSQRGYSYIFNVTLFNNEYIILAIHYKYL